VRYAGGHYEGPLALPMQPTDIPDPEKDNTSPGDGGQLPSPLPPGSGPWGGAGERQGAPEGPWGRPAGNQLVPPIRSPDSSRGKISSGTSDRKRH
jgi:hypothetical protein